MDTLDRRYRRMIGDETSDALLEAGIHLHLLFRNHICGHIAFGQMGGLELGATRTLVAGGPTPREAALGLLRTPEHYRPRSLQTSLWALSEAAEIAADKIEERRVTLEAPGFYALASEMDTLVGAFRGC